MAGTKKVDRTVLAFGAARASAPHWPLLCEDISRYKSWFLLPLTASDVLWRSLNSYIANQAHGCASESYSPAQVSSTVQYGGIKLAPLPPVNATLATAALVMGLYASGIVLQKLNSLSISMLAKWPAYFEVLLPKAVFPTC